jgi:hypothetical protein
MHGKRRRLLRLCSSGGWISQEYTVINLRMEQLLYETLVLSKDAYSRLLVSFRCIPLCIYRVFDDGISHVADRL